MKTGRFELHIFEHEINSDRCQACFDIHNCCELFHLVEQIDQIAVFVFGRNEDVALLQSLDCLVFVGKLDLNWIL